MNVVIIRGRLAGAPVPRTLASGAQLLSLEITAAASGGTASVPVAWFDPPDKITFAEGDEVVVRGSVRRRFFRSGGATQSRTEVLAVEVVLASRRRQVEGVVSRAAAEMTDDAPVSRAS